MCPARGASCVQRQQQETLAQAPFRLLTERSPALSPSRRELAAQPVNPVLLAGKECACTFQLNARAHRHVSEPPPAGTSNAMVMPPVKAGGG